MKRGETPAILAVSWGKGDPQKDAVSVVYVNEQGQIREWVTLDNLVADEHRDEFQDIVKRRRPDAIVVGGLTIATSKLAQRVKELVTESNTQPTADVWGESPSTGGTLTMPVIYVFDDVARLFQHSPRAELELAYLTTTQKYCVGLARYAQSPLNEFASLGADLATINFDPDHSLVSARF